MNLVLPVFEDLLVCIAVDNVTFDSLIGELEKRYEKNYQGLAWSTFLFMMLGYFVLLLSILALLGIIAFLVLMLMKAPNAITIKIGLGVGIVVVPVLFHLLTSLWVRTSAPEGIEIHPKQAPELFAELQKIAAKSSKIHFSKVLVNGDFNACVVNTPRLGIFGWSKHHLVIGLPLMEAMQRDEFVSILAHEYAHFSHEHGKLGNWIYRARSTWVKTSECIFARDSVFVRPLQLFFGWFWPRLNAKSFVVSRMNEYQADAFAVEMTSAEVASDALARVHVQAVRADREFWGKLTERAAKEADVPKNIMGDLCAWLATPNPKEQALLAESYASVTDSVDTHPCLRDRVAAITGLSAQELVIPKQLPHVLRPASEELFPFDLVTALRKKLNEKWMSEVGVHWKERHEAIQTALKEVEGLDDSKVSRWRRIEVHAEVFGMESVATQLEEFAAAFPDHVSARFFLARHLLDQLDPRGESMMVAMKDYNPHLASAAVSLLSDYYQRTGNRLRVRQVSADYDELSRNFHNVEVERGVADINDEFMPHQLSTEDLESLLNFLRTKEVVKQLYITRKVCRHYPEWPHYYMIVKIKFPMLSLETDHAKQELINAILNAASFDGSMLLHTIDHAPKSCVKNIQAIPDSIVYRHTDG